MMIIKMRHVTEYKVRIKQNPFHHPLTNEIAAYTTLGMFCFYQGVNQTKSGHMFSPTSSPPGNKFKK
jgi:hypothetical protein